MATLTIRNLDDAVKRRLRVMAAEHGVSMEEEARLILRASLLGASVWEAGSNPPSEQEPVWHLDITRDELLEFGRKPADPIDIKRLSDEMWDESL